MLPLALVDLLATPLLVLYALVVVYVACVLGMHLRGKERLRFERQLTEHSGLLSPLNCIFYAFSAVPKDPVLPASTFPQLQVLKDNWKTIRAEAVELMTEGRIAFGEEHNDLTFLNFRKLGWKRFHLRWYYDFLPSALEHCPRTVELVRGIPGLNAAAFTMLPPGGRLGAHRDPLASSLRYHLGLVAPNDAKCRLYVDGEEVVWHEGEDFVFDETYVHWAHNETDVPRIIFFADMTRPLHFAPVRLFNEFLIRYVYRITRSANEQGETPGALNRITPVFYGLKRFFRGIKTRTNRKLYYTVKYALFALLIFFVVRGLAT